MITEMRLAPRQTVKGLSQTYIADADGFVAHVDTGDVRALLVAGGVPVVIPATLNLKVKPGQTLYFGSGTHHADAAGVVRDVPFDTAMIMIKADDHPAVEASAEDLEASDMLLISASPASGLVETDVVETDVVETELGDKTAVPTPPGSPVSKALIEDTPAPNADSVKTEIVPETAVITDLADGAAAPGTTPAPAAQ